VCCIDLSRAIFRKNPVELCIFAALQLSVSPQREYSTRWSIRDHLTVAAIAMALSSISVVLSSLSLRLYRPPNVSISNSRRRRRNRSSTVWARSMQQRNTTQGNHDDNDLAVQLLDNDHLAASEVTEIADNRSLKSNGRSSSVQHYLEGNDVVDTLFGFYKYFITFVRIQEHRCTSNCIYR
jgi:hypothetical protein